MVTIRKEHTGSVPHLPYAVDNGAYAAWKDRRTWCEEPFIKILDRAITSPILPEWVAAPDVVTNAIATLKLWKSWCLRLKREYHVRVALVVQDGMTIDQVRDLDPQPDLLFVGGSTEWKWESLPGWCSIEIPVHVGRVNGEPGLLRCYELGVDSVDGTGWFMGRVEQLDVLERFLKMQSDPNRPHLELSGPSRNGRSTGPEQGRLFG